MRFETRLNIKSLKASLARFALGVVLLSGAYASVAAATELQVFLAPYGDDKAAGTLRSAPVASLQSALRIALAHEEEDFDQIRINVAPGVYSEQRATIQARRSDKPLLITPDPHIPGRPRFEGGGKGGTWLTVKSASGRPTRITIKGMEITNYVTAISFNGDRETVTSSNGLNVLRNNVFSDIGQIAFPNGPKSTAAVRLVNSHHNEIVRNRFVNIRNLQGCGALHSIYIAHNSVSNSISENVFDGGCGATIKVRDASNDNHIFRNQFLRQDAPVFEDSYCDKSTREDCTKQGPECPSQGNAFRQNTVKIAAAKNAKNPIYIKGDDAPPACAGVRAGHRRLVEENNIFN